jgi:heme exporter protein C
MASSLHRFANPNRFMRLSGAILPWAVGLTVVLFPIGLYLALIDSPPDYQQGESVRIMYVHVPAAWMALFVYSVMAVASAVALIWRHPVADIAARAASPIGAGFTFVALATGALWGQPMWGTWWVWDARLTSVLILFFLYLGHMALFDAFDDPTKGARAAAILALVGAVNVPIIHYSVEWWNTLHQPASVLRGDGPAIAASMLWPLMIMALAFKTYFVTILLVRMRSEITMAKLRALRRTQVEGAASGAVPPIVEADRA